MVIWEVFISKDKAIKVTKIQLNVENECLLSHLPKLSSWTSLQGRFWVLVFDTPDLDLPAVCVCVCVCLRVEISQRNLQPAGSNV